MSRDISVDASFLESQRAKAEERRRRFEAAAREPPPPLPKRSMAWPGGKIVTPNKAEAIASFLERKAGSLDEAKERVLLGELGRAAAEAGAGAAAAASAGAAAASGAAVSSSRALAGLTLALSAGGDESGVGQAELAKSIRAAGGVVSNTVHKRVDLLVASARAVKRNTQAVRKARGKFRTPIVSPGPRLAETGPHFLQSWSRLCRSRRPPAASPSPSLPPSRSPTSFPSAADFVIDSIAAGSKRDPALYAPTADRAARAAPPAAAASAAPLGTIAARAVASGSGREGGGGATAWALL